MGYDVANWWASAASCPTGSGSSGRSRTTYSRVIDGPSPRQLVSLPSIRRSAARSGSSYDDWRVSSSWASSTTPAAPRVRAAAALCTPMPPRARTGRSVRARIRWTSTKPPSAPTRPPLSLPVATRLATPHARASRASAVETTSASTRAGPRPQPDLVRELREVRCGDEHHGQGVYGVQRGEECVGTGGMRGGDPQAPVGVRVRPEQPGREPPRRRAGAADR